MSATAAATKRKKKKICGNEKDENRTEKKRADR
jgi:hypothetical protein